MYKYRFLLILPLLLCTSFSDAKTIKKFEIDYIDWDIAQQSKGVSSIAKMSKKAIINYPDHAYQDAHSNIFFSHRDFYICVENCKLPQPNFMLNENENGVLSISKRNLSRKEKKKLRVISNVYYWLSQLFDFMHDEIGFVLNKRLQVLVDLNIDEPQSGNKFENNAFYENQSHTLGFVPKKNSLLLRISGYRLRESGLDPSVILHEAGHSIFQQLLGVSLNGVSYLHEGFADFIARSFLLSSDIGYVMIKKKAVRNCDENIVYSDHNSGSGHNNGNVFSCAIHNIINKENRIDVIKAVMKAVKEYGEMAYSSPSLLTLMINSEISVISQELGMELFKSFVNSELPSKYYLPIVTLPDSLLVAESSDAVEFEYKATYSDDFSSALGLEKHDNYNFSCIKYEETYDLDNSIIRWYKIGMRSNGVLRSIWVGKSGGQIRGVFREGDLSPVNFNDEDEKVFVQEIMSRFSDGVSWCSSHDKKLRELVNGENTTLSSAFDVSEVKDESIGITLNRSSRMARVRGYSFRFRGGMRLLNSIFGKMLYDVFPYSEVEFITIPKESLSNNNGREALVEFRGEMLIGVRKKYRSGAIESYMIYNFGDVGLN